MVVAGFVAPAATSAAGPTAATAAETTLEVRAGYGGGNYLPGKSVPVRVQIESDRLIRGTLLVRLELPGASEPPLRVPVEVSGGSNKTVVVALPTPVGIDAATVAVSIQGERLSGEAEITVARSTELVGLLPDLVSRAPDRLTLPGGLGSAAFDILGAASVSTPGALDPLGTIVAGPDGLAPLTEAARANVLAWLADGGRLVVDAAPGAPITGLPDAWQPGAADHLRLGRGEIALADGAVAAGRWDEVVVPTSLVTTTDFGGGLVFGFEDLPTAIGRDGGLRVPSVGWLAAFLGVYVLLVGPVLFLVLRRLGRTNWTWLAVTAAAVVFAAGAFAVGTDLRSGTATSHGTVVETSPGGAQATSYVGLISRSGEDPRAVFPGGWAASSLTTALRGMDPGLRFPGDDTFAVDPAQVSVTPGETVGEVDLDPGGVGMVVGWGRLDERTGGLEVTAVAHPDGRVTGTLHNATGQDLHEALVMVGYRSWGGDPLAAGETVEWEIDAAAGNPEADAMFRGDVPEQPWRAAAGFEREPDPDSPVNYPLWSERTSRTIDPYPTGVVVAAGWSRTWTPPVDVKGPVEKGRTVFVTEAAVTATPGAVPPSAVGRDVLRFRSATAEEDDRYGADAAEWGELAAMTMRFSLPPGDAAGLQATLPGHVAGVAAWDGSAWVPLTRVNRGGAALEDGELRGDPWDPGAVTFADIPPEAVRDGAVLLTLYMADVGGPVGYASVGQTP